MVCGASAAINSSTASRRVVAHSTQHKRTMQVVHIAFGVHASVAVAMLLHGCYCCCCCCCFTTTRSCCCLAPEHAACTPKSSGPPLTRCACRLSTQLLQLSTAAIVLGCWRGLAKLQQRTIWGRMSFWCWAQPGGRYIPRQLLCLFCELICQKKVWLCFLPTYNPPPTHTPHPAALPPRPD